MPLLSSRKFYSLLPIYPSLSFALVYTLRNTSYLCALLLVSTLHIFPVILLSEKMVSYLSLFLLHSEKAMAPHFSTLAWKLPWTEEPGRLQSRGSRRIGHDFTFTFHFHALEKEMATHYSVLAWRIPGTGEPGGLPCMAPKK